MVLQPRQPLHCCLPHSGWANPRPLQTTPDEQRATCNGITGGHSPARCLLLHTQVSPDRVQRGHGVSVGPLQPQPRCHNEGCKETQCAQFPTLPGTGDSVPLEAFGSAPCASKLRAAQQQPKTFPWVRRDQRAQGARCNDQVTLQPWGDGEGGGNPKPEIMNTVPSAYRSRDPTGHPCPALPGHSQGT